MKAFEILFSTLYSQIKGIFGWIVEEKAKKYTIFNNLRNVRIKESKKVSLPLVQTPLSLITSLCMHQKIVMLGSKPHP
jgi:hypothetical protein